MLVSFSRSYASKDNGSELV
jgi:hypothetical protein